MQQSQSDRHSTSSWFTRLRFHCIVFFYILFGLMQTAFAETRLEIDSKNQNNHCTAQIISTQVAKAETDLAVVPQTGWIDVKLPDNWENRWDNYTGSAWYKIVWRLNCSESISGPPFAFVVDRINMAGIVYSNNELIWRDASLVEPLSRSWNKPRYWLLPSSSLKQEHNEILVRVVGVQSQKSGLGVVKIGDVKSITDLHKELVFERRTLFLINLLITMVLGTIGFLIWLFRRQETAFGWFSINSLFWSLFICNTLLTAPFPFTDSLLHARLNIIFLLVYAYTACLFVWRFSHEKFKHLEKTLATFVLLFSLALLLTPDDHLSTVMSIAFLYSSVIYILNCFFIQWIAYKKKKIDIYLLAAVFMLFMVIMLHDLSLMSNSNLESIYWTPFAAPITSLAISFILSWRIARNMRHIEKFNQTLEETVETVTFDLEQSLAKKHHLQLENMRLQERLNLSHELHDGLGGSIVRSMILLDHAENVEKNQVMSMFKLLRSDLRQVIDSGSSIGAKTPESPVMWVAPLRHRFVQIFEEMEIESTWIFSNHWNIKPPPLYCLTLSRVTEEALTNIVKHSDATDVEVSLFENDQNELILEIKDNGHGFEVNAVEKGLHVGLQSMQVRIKRLGGELEITSQSGLTVIRAILPMKE